MSLAKVGQHGPQHQDGGAHGLDQLIGCSKIVGAPGIHFDTQFLVDSELNTHAPQQLDHGSDVVQVWQVANDDRFIGKQCCRKNGQCSIFRAGDLELAFQAVTAGDK